MTAEVFLSYRGADRALARRLERRLRSRWGSRVFLDGTGIMPGISWEKQLDEALRQARVVAALIGPGWALQPDTDAVDWVRTELVTAIGRGVPVLPILIGDPEPLRKKLQQLPEAFGLQAVQVSSDLTGLDVQQIVRALESLGAFSRSSVTSLGSRRRELIPPAAQNRLAEAIGSGRSVLVEGSPGSGRSGMLTGLRRQGMFRPVAPPSFAGALAGGANMHRSAEPALRQQPVLVASYGLDPVDGTRRTHALIASWLSSLGTTIRGLPSAVQREQLGAKLVHAVLERGPDLISRRVVQAGDLVKLSKDNDSAKILEASRRGMDRWAPYPPHRLVNQARGVLEAFVEKTGVGLLLIADDFDEVDGNSRALVADLLTDPVEGLQLVLSASPPRDPARRYSQLLRIEATEADGWDGVSEPEPGTLDLIELDDEELWGRDGATLRTWLAVEHVELDAQLLEAIQGPNPARSLALLWYLADEGYVIEEPERVVGRTPNQPDVDGGRARWKLSVPPDALPRPSAETLFDHLVAVNIPGYLQPVLEAGALCGRSFDFDIAARAAVALRPDTLGGESSGDWEARRDRAWAALSTLDSDAVVVECAQRGEHRTVVFSQGDLATYLRGRLSQDDRNRLRGHLAEAYEEALAVVPADEIDERFLLSSEAATHWQRAGDLRRAADAHRRAAYVAEQGLAYREAQDSYRSSIRLLTQLIADSDDPTGDIDAVVRENEDYLVLGNSLYRLGQMVRLSGQWPKDRAPDTYFETALRHVGKLRNAPRASTSGVRASDGGAPERVPLPDRLRHNYRLAQALAGYIYLELATWYETTDPARARQYLFETLRHAEGARGEGSSRWLLASASARLAEQLAEEAIEVADDVGDVGERCKNLAVEAMFHIERVIGLQAISDEEERDLAEPRATARKVQGRLFQHLHLEPAMAMWSFRVMNRPMAGMRAAADLSTDKALGDFLLSVAPLGTGPELREAVTLLEGYLTWATESGMGQLSPPVLRSLVIAELVANAGRVTARAEELLSLARRRANEEERRRLGLLAVALAALDPVDDPARAPAASGPEAVRDAVAAAHAFGGPEAVWVAVYRACLTVCPRLAGRVQRAAEDDLGAPLFAPVSELANATARAAVYLERFDRMPSLAPTVDRTAERLAECRLPTPIWEHSKRTAAQCAALLEVHGAAVAEEEPVGLETIGRDLALASLVHDWYRGIDAARMLTLAGEWGLQVSGSEWANPLLLHGALAAHVLAQQYEAGVVLGQERWQRIESMLRRHTVGRKDAPAVERLFVLADALARDPEPDTPGALAPTAEWRELAMQPGQLAAAYDCLIRSKASRVRANGRMVDPSSTWVFDVEPTVDADVDLRTEDRALPVLARSALATAEGAD